jgi:hypothetical protein
MCVAVFDRFHAAVAPAATKLGLAENAADARRRPANQAALAACERWPEPARNCLLHAVVGPDAWTACKVESPFVFFDGAAVEASLFGAPLPAAESSRRIASLAGTWRGDQIIWTISPDGSLAARRSQTPPGKPPELVDEPAHTLSFARERQLAIQTGPATQLVPAYVDGDRLFLGWTSHSLALPIEDEDAFSLYLGDSGRWLVWSEPDCTLLEPHVGAIPATCSWKDKTFTIRDERGHELAWKRVGNALVHPAMNELDRQGK